MNQIKENQELNLTNVISIRKKLYQEELSVFGMANQISSKK